MKKTIKILIVLSAIVAIGVGYYFMQNEKEETSKETRKISVVYQEEGVTPSFVLEVGTAKDIFKKNGLELEKIPSLQNVDKIFTSGQADIVLFGTNWLSLYFQEVDMKWIANYSNYRPDYILSKFNEDDVKSIKKVAIKKLGSPDELNMRLLLKAWGVDPNSVSFVVAPADNVKIDQLKKGNVDIVSIIDKSQAQQLSKNGFNLLDVKDELKDVSMGTEAAVLSSKMDNRSEDFRNFVKAIYETDQYIIANKDDTITILKDKFKLDDQKAENYYSEYVAALKNKNYIPSTESIKKVMDSMIEMSKPKNPNRDLNGLVYTDFAKNAINLLGIK